ncbi:tRNA (adenosine(37)-N6)-threonylcarbamoyltransferase complex dimerization subunit type 1 TsaB [Nonlabens spongiae]|uniref:N(6)-L-threonylcarbamoyladenine synthase n=1 Tax=Nonlabens spongiae TaxID=331648 RepID=A0A1W6ML10_9FLAO|nr:tRNA (adenosine(37)-N6)-threonylcarbamoyltransferase complex dimerization subunit type 1 TsaB [Nonlabens spongiae]ARN78298.1 tRNA (adenosine(37)-N6)-threonylcarbamoyltransferase complex dimerization subunit type 1 TsaB [Nonlabens spongiae]
MHILCIETTSTNCSVALAGESGNFSNSLGISNCIDLIEDQSDNYSHGERLHVFIEQILNRNEIQTKDLSAIAVSAGPGSYTGLRIGVSAAKGLCYALDIPLISIDTLTALSFQNNSDIEKCITFLDARRMEVYARVFQNNLPQTEVEAVVLDQNSFSEYFNEPTVILGTGVSKFEDIIENQNVRIQTSRPTALTMCDLAVEKFRNQEFEKDVAYFEPFYLKEFKAG